MGWTAIDPISRQLKMVLGPKNSIADVKGIKVGNAEDKKLKSGVTVLLCDEPMVASVAVHGGAPGHTRHRIASA